MPRRPGQLTKEDKLKLQSQGLPPDCQGELDIVEKRCKLDKRLQVVEIISGKSLSREVVLESIAHLLNTTQKDGGKYTTFNFQSINADSTTRGTRVKFEHYLHTIVYKNGHGA